MCRCEDLVVTKFSDHPVVARVPDVESARLSPPRRSRRPMSLIGYCRKSNCDTVSHRHSAVLDSSVWSHVSPSKPENAVSWPDAKGLVFTWPLIVREGERWATYVHTQA